MSPYVCRSFEDKARELDIPDVPGFYSSDQFNAAGFRLLPETMVIVHDG